MLIFNLHHVEPEPAISRTDSNRRHISVTPQGLRQVIRTLRRLGREPADMRDVLVRGGPSADDGRFLLTFDDGFENFYRYAVPVLEEECCPATVFVLPGRLGGTNEWDQGSLPERQRDRLMTLGQMQSLARSHGISVGSHGLLHRNFAALGPDALHAEIHHSHAMLQRELGDTFLPVLAYPWGSYSSGVLAVMAQSPYRFAFTTQKGRWLPDTVSCAVPRYSLYYRDGNPLVFCAKLLRNGLLTAPRVKLLAASP